MRRPLKSKIFIFLLLSFVAHPSSALVIVEGSFTALVSDYYHYTGEHSDFGTPTAGTEISGSFSYAVTINLTGPYEEPNMTSYSEGPDWIKFNFNVGGIDFAVAPSPAIATSSDLTVQKATPDSWWDFYDMFWMRESLSRSSPVYVNRGAEILIWGGVDDLGAIQDFSFSNYDVEATLSLWSGGIHNGNRYDSSVDATIVDFKIASRTVDVPEPSGLLLSALAFLFVGWRTLKSR